MIRDFEIISAVELTAGEYSDLEYKSPENYREYWLKCLSDIGLEKLITIQNSSLVDIATIEESELELLLKLELAQSKDKTSIYFMGGIVVNVGTEYPIVPTCCGDLGNIAEWESIASKATEKWQDLWIGHPWVYYRRKGQGIQFSEYFDGNPDDLDTIESKLFLSEQELKVKILAAKERQIELGKKIHSILNEMGLKISAKKANAAVGIF